MDEKECPLCAEKMRIVVRETVERIPGSPQEVRRTVREWVCPECDYFEEDETNPDQATGRPA
jgi:hypothetical protein